MIIKQPELINPAQEYGHSVYVREFVYPFDSHNPKWHHHNEIELVYINTGSGKRHIGSHLSYFEDGNLVLIGPNIPHYSFSQLAHKDQSITGVMIGKQLETNEMLDLPEMVSIKSLLERSNRGIAFGGSIKHKIGKKMQKLLKTNSFNKTINTLSILHQLAESDDYELLNTESYSIEIAPQDNERLNHVLNYVREHFQEPIPLDVIASETNMAAPSFCRYFKKKTGKNFTKFVNEFRLVHASKLLAEKPASISDICYESGFSNFSYFNRQFKQFTGKSPSQYRNNLKQIININNS